LAAVAIASGCAGIPAPGEREARLEAGAVAAAYRPIDREKALPDLTPDSSLSEFIRYAMLHQPSVEAAYLDWLASVESITVARSLPDPRLMFETDITRIVQTSMPGLIMDFPVLAKLSALGQAASADSQRRYFAFEMAVLRAANIVRRTYYQLHLLDEKIRIEGESLKLAADLEAIARRQNEVGKVTTQDVLRAQIEQDRLRNEIANLEDSRAPLRAAFRAALGVRPTAPDPPFPARFEFTPAEKDIDQILKAAMSHNPELKALEAEVRRGEALIRAARRDRWPNVSVGVEADALAVPTMVRPQFAISLPIWRDKIAAQIAAAQATKGASDARLSAEQIRLAAELAEKSFTIRQSARNLALARDIVGPKARQSLEVARASYLADKSDFLNLVDSWRTVLDIEIEAIEARTEREIALADISLLLAGLPPAGAPVLANEPRGPTPPQPKKTPTRKVSHGTKH